MSMLSGVAYGGAISAAARRHGVDPTLLAAVAAQETGGPGASSGRNVVGDGGHGHGLFQIDDRWHPFASTPGAMDPAQNADYAAGLLRQNLDATHGDVRGALSMYNTGSASGTTGAAYARSVLAHRATIASDAGMAQANAGVTSTQLRADNSLTASLVNGLQSLAQLFGLGGAGASATEPQATVQIAMPTQQAGSHTFKGADPKSLLVSADLGDDA